jgi:hypothetical protein
VIVAVVAAAVVAAAAAVEVVGYAFPVLSSQHLEEVVAVVAGEQFLVSGSVAVQRPVA